MKRIPIHDETVPIACTIAPEEIPGRIALVARMRDHLLRLDRTEHGLLLHFPPSADVESDLQRFAVDEKRCCSFWGFDVQTDDGLALRWNGPPTAAALLDRLEAYFSGEEPDLDLAGLL